MKRLLNEEGRVRGEFVDPIPRLEHLVVVAVGRRGEVETARGGGGGGERVLWWWLRRLVGGSIGSS